ncbi:MAG: hypothetical protein QXP55_04065 [Nitrososphaerales archaeon]
MSKMVLSKSELKTLVNELKESYALLNFKEIDSNVAKQLQMIKRRRRVGMKLVALGIGAIVFPEPTGLSDIFGIPLLALGMLIEKAYDFIGISDVIQELSNTLKSFASLKLELCC